MSCCKHVIIDKHVDIKTLLNTYRAIMRQDPDTGVISSGLCDRPVTGYTEDSVLHGLQTIVDIADNITTYNCIMVDPGLCKLRIQALAVGVTEDQVGIRFDPVQYRVGDDPTATIGCLPERWIIRDDTPENVVAMVAAIKALDDAKKALASAEQALEGLTTSNPITPASLTNCAC